MDGMKENCFLVFGIMDAMEKSKINSYDILSISCYSDVCDAFILNIVLQYDFILLICL